MNETELDLEEIETFMEAFKEAEPETYNMYKDTEMLSDEDIYEIITSPVLDRIFKGILWTITEPTAFLV